MNVVDLFAGIGWGFACRELGLHEHGYDIEPTVTATREALGMKAETADVLDLDPADWAGVDGLIASPPCQSWSRAGKGLGLNDPRGQLVWQPLVWALAVRPRWVACEQVPEARGAFEVIAHRLPRGRLPRRCLRALGGDIRCRADPPPRVPHRAP